MTIQLKQTPKVLSEKGERIAGHVEDWHDCQRCPLGRIALNHVMIETFPAGVESLDLLFVGEGPGRDENRTGRPFVGRSGTFLRRLISEAGVEGVAYGITNVVACRPADSPTAPNRAPLPSEVKACAPRVQEIMQIYSPKSVVLLGRYAKDFVGFNLRKYGYNGLIRNMAHPAYYLYQGKEDDQTTIDTLSRKLREWLLEVKHENPN